MLSSMALLMLLRRMGRRDLTAHGFRATFRDWAARAHEFPEPVVEMALAHVLSNAPRGRIAAAIYSRSGAS
jgi:integrase